MKLPGSAADLPKGKQVGDNEQYRPILAIVCGEKVFLTRKEAFALASQLVISLEVDDDRR